MRIIIIIIFFFSVIFSQNDGYVDSTKVRNPKLAWKLALIPGVGQLYNGKYLKAFGTMGVEYFAIDKFNHYKALEKIGMRNTYAWWIFGLYIWNLLDSYVDAQLSTFPKKKLKSTNYSIDSLKVNKQ